MNSENVKNWVTIISIVVGGFWVLYQWNTIFPKTSSEIEVSVADLRTRTSGDIKVEIFPAADGTVAVTTNGKPFDEACQNASKVQLRIPARAALALSSNAPIPVRVEIKEFLLAEALGRFTLNSEVTEPPAQAPVFIADGIGDITSVPLEAAAFVGGLNWTHVEPQGSGIVAVLGSINFPFSCSYGGSEQTPAEFAIGLKAIIQAVKPDGTLGESVDRYFYQFCAVNADGGSTCPAPTLGESWGDDEPTSTFKLIAQ